MSSRKKEKKSRSERSRSRLAEDSGDDSIAEERQQRRSHRKDRKRERQRTQSGERKSVQKQGGQKQSNISADFEAGLLFEKYAGNKDGKIQKEDFLQIWRELNDSKANNDLPSVRQHRASPLDRLKANQLFQRYDPLNQGFLSREGFAQILSDLEMFGKDIVLQCQQGEGDYSIEKPRSSAWNSNTMPTHHPMELYTHFDETSGVPLDSSRVQFHTSQGHEVVSLSDAFKARQNVLSGLVSSLVLPRRERILRALRHVQNLRIDLQRKRGEIERETKADADAVLERLRSVEVSTVPKEVSISLVKRTYHAGTQRCRNLLSNESLSSRA